jgi:hypothetical protein
VSTHGHPLPSVPTYINRQDSTQFDNEEEANSRGVLQISAVQNHGKIGASKPVSRILFPEFIGTVIIPLALPLLIGSSDLPESHQPVAAISNHCVMNPRSPAIAHRRYEALRSGSLLLSYLVLLRAGFTLPPTSLSGRCALTLSRLSDRTFSPLPRKIGAVYFLWHFPCRRRTPRNGDPPPTLAVNEHTTLRSSDFPLPRSRLHGQTLAGMAHAQERGSDHPACSHQFYVNLPVGGGQTTLWRLAKAINTMATGFQEDSRFF